MAYVLSEKSADWLRDAMGREGGRQVKQYTPRFQGRRGGGSGEVKVLKVVGGNPLEGFDVLVYDGYKQLTAGQSTGSAKCFIADIALDAAIPPGTILLGHSVAVPVAGGSET